MSDQYSFLQGTMYMAQRSATNDETGFVSLGNAPSVSINLGALADLYAPRNASDQRTMRSSDGGAPTIDITLESLSKDNLLLGLYGVSSDSPGGGSNSYTRTAYIGKTSVLPSINMAAFVALKSTDGNITYTLGKDYVADARYGTFTALAGGRIADGQLVSAIYNESGFSTITAFSAAPKPVWLRFEGINGADNKPIVVDIYRVRVQPVESLMLLGDTLTSLSMRGRILPDRYNLADQTQLRVMRIRKG